MPSLAGQLARWRLEGLSSPHGLEIAVAGSAGAPWLMETPFGKAVLESWN